MQLPQAFVNRLQKELSSFAALMCDAITGHETNTSIRINGKKSVASALSGLELGDKIPWCKDAYFLLKRPSFTLDPNFQAGAYYVQEAASMVLSAVLEKLPKPEQALDLCAAPGGKSLILLDALAKNGFLVANEIVPKRAQVLQENIDKWGSSRVSIVSGEARELANAGAKFDCILVDAPCSGEGLFGKDDEAIKLWHEGMPLQNANLQMAILNDILPALAPGGHLIYSTCTYGRCENEDIWVWLRKQGLEAVSLDFPTEWGFIDVHTIFPDIASGKAYRALPGFSKGLGFFICAFKNTGDQARREVFLEPEEYAFNVSDQLTLGEALQLFSHKNQVYYAATTRQKAVIQRLAKYVRVIRPGGAIGQHNEQHIGLVPAHALAMSFDVATNFPVFNLPPKQALWYLARKNFQPTGLPKSYFKIVCNGLPLGWGFNKKDRFINCFPTHLKIRMKL